MSNFLPSKIFLLTYFLHNKLLLDPFYHNIIFTFLIAPNPSFLGDFENHLYETKNDWHYVKISYNYGQGTYTWRNKAGISWTLYPTNNGNQLKVGNDCPYYKNGHVKATFDANGVAGPWGEIYSRRCRLSFNIHLAF